MYSCWCHYIHTAWITTKHIYSYMAIICSIWISQLCALTAVIITIWHTVHEYISSYMYKHMLVSSSWCQIGSAPFCCIASGNDSTTLFDLFLVKHYQCSQSDTITFSQVLQKWFTNMSRCFIEIIHGHAHEGLMMP